MYVLCPFTGTMAKLLTQTLLVLPTVAFFVPMMCLAFYWGHAHPVKKLQSYLELITRPITRLLGPLFHYISSCFFFLMSCCACGRHWTRRYRRRKLRAKREKESRRKVLSPQDLESGLIFEEDLEKICPIVDLISFLRSHIYPWSRAIYSTKVIYCAWF